MNQEVRGERLMCFRFTLTRFLELLLIGLVGSTTLSSIGQPIRFYTSPYRVFEGDAVRFVYFEQTNTIAKSNIVSWSWDFDGDGNMDTNGLTASGIDATWYAFYDPARATNGVVSYTPVLRVVSTNQGLGTLSTNTQLGITEDVSSYDDTVDPHFFVLARALGNSEIQINFTANPRLSTNGQTVRFYSDITLLVTGRVDQVQWSFGDLAGFTATGSAVTHPYTLSSGSNQVFDVAMRVTYSVRQTDGTY